MSREKNNVLTIYNFYHKYRGIETRVRDDDQWTIEYANAILWVYMLS